MFNGFIEGAFHPVSKRRIRLDACKMYGYRCAKVKDETLHVADYRDAKGVVAQHVRYVDNKFFTWNGEAAAVRQLYGQHLFGSGGKRIIIAKGEIDTLTIAQAQGLKWPTVGIPGYTMASFYIKHAYEFLNSFETIVLAFDETEAGIQTSEEVATMFPAGKVKLMRYGQYADANEMEMENAGDKIVPAMWQAQDYRPDGIIMGSELWEHIIKEPPEGLEIPYPELNRRLRGLRTGNIFMLTAGSGLGKSTFAHELGWHLLTEHKQKLGVLALEEAMGRCAARYISKPLERGDFHVNRAGIDESAVREAFDGTINNPEDENFCLYNHRGSKDIKAILSKIRFMAISLKMKWIILDHVSIIVSGLTGQMGSDERKTLDVLMTELSGLVEELDIGLIAVVHLKRTEKKYNEGAKVSLSDLRGTAGLEQLSHVVISLERDQQNEEQKNYCTLRLLKDRDIGDTGKADTMQYFPDTGRLLACANPPKFKDQSKEGGYSGDDF